MVENRVESFVLQNGVWRCVDCGYNTRTYEGADALAAIAAGTLVSPINTMYFAFQTGGGAAPIATSAATKASDFRALSPPNDFLRVELGNAITDINGADYEANRATFIGFAPLGMTGYGGTVLAAGHEITHLGLAISPDRSDPLQDRLYAVYTPVAVITVPASGGVSYAWRVTFTAV